jgi:predicted transcriptional regulator
MTLLDRLTRKGAVSRRKQARGFRYTPVFSREAVVDLAVERRVEDPFDSSREELAAHLGEGHWPRDQAFRMTSPKP